MKSYVTLSIVALLGLSACGGTTSQAVPDLTADSNPANAQPQPAATQAADALPEIGAAQQAQVPPATIAVNSPVSNLSTFVADQALLDGAFSVGCDADAAIFSDTMLEVINASRSIARMCGMNQRDVVSPLVWNDTLAQAALIHGNDMATNNFFSHDGSDGLGVSDRATSVGYSWRAIGENLAAGQLDIAEAHQGWLDSPGHCDNVMNKLYTEVGASCVSDSGADFGTYWVVVFGNQR